MVHGIFKFFLVSSANKIYLTGVVSNGKSQIYEYDISKKIIIYIIDLPQPPPPLVDPSKSLNIGGRISFFLNDKIIASTLICRPCLALSNQESSPR